MGVNSSDAGGLQRAQLPCSVLEVSSETWAPHPSGRLCLAEACPLARRGQGVGGTGAPQPPTGRAGTSPSDPTEGARWPGAQDEGKGCHLLPHDNRRPPSPGVSQAEPPLQAGL